MEKHKNAATTCKLCDKTFTKKYMKVHIVSVHEKIRFKCDQCDYETSQRKYLNHHKSRRHGVLKCDQCDKTFKKTSLKVHIASVHEKIRFECDQCDYKASHRKATTLHKMSMHEGKFLKCDQCDKQFQIMNGKRRLAIHKRFNHENKRFECDQCDKKFAYKGSLKLHFKESLNCHKNSNHSVLFVCHECQRKLSSSIKLKSHMQSFHGNYIIKCDKCDSDLKAKTKLKNTKRKNTMVSNTHVTNVTLKAK